MVSHKGKVHILLSAYNGEKYISDQIESLLQQDYDNYTIFVRDDGSTDNTRAILRSYRDRGDITLLEGENIGFKKSFGELLRSCTGAAYYSFCDQDDIWMPNKISLAVHALQQYENTPALYISDFYWADQEAKPYRRENAAGLPHNLERRIIQSDLHAFGFTQVFNETCAKGVRERKALELYPHDDTIYTYALCMGKVIWGETPCVYYRRHDENASRQKGKEKTALVHLKKVISYFLFEYRQEQYYERIKEFYTVFESVLPAEKKKVFALYTEPGHRLQKAFLLKRYGDTWGTELGTRCLFLLGKL